jgi:redox-sensitive bicupin YhaK (pirin superfamily)
MKKILYPSNTRGSADYGWLKANYSFSFANYYDPQRIQFGALRVLNDDTIAPGMGFGKHPHDNMEIVTIPLSGGVLHEDSMGHKGTVMPGEVQVMSAGSGVTHSEFNASTTEPLKLFQIWVFPDRQNVSPRYDQKTIASLLKKNELSPIVVPRDSANEDQLWIHQNAYFFWGEFDSDQNYSFSLSGPGQGLYLMVVEGSANLADQTLNVRDALGIWDCESLEISIKANTKILALEVPL